jgi:hypothetical protein
MELHTSIFGTTKKRGRPKGTTRTPPDRLQTVCLKVEQVKALARQTTGEELSDSRACDLIARQGGLAWIVGGDRDALADAMSASRNQKSALSRLRRFKLDEKSSRLVKDKEGPIFVDHFMQHSRSIRSRYVEAKALVEADPCIKEAWANILSDMLGLPRHITTRRSFGTGPFA